MPGKIILVFFKRVLIAVKLCISQLMFLNQSNIFCNIDLHQVFHNIDKLCCVFSLSLFIMNLAECKVWRNPLNLFRGSEYSRLTKTMQKEPLTYYDMNLSAQDHQTFFTCEADANKPEYQSMWFHDHIYLFVALSITFFLNRVSERNLRNNGWLVTMCNSKLKFPMHICF